MSEQTPQNQEPQADEELNSQELEDVAGGSINGNCNCAANP